MPDDSSLPYLNNITIKPTLPSDGNHVTVSITWTVQSIRPDQVQIYRLFGPSSPALIDTGNLVWTAATNVAMPLVLTFSGANFNPILNVCVAPRTLVNGSVSDTMVDASGEESSWDNFITQEAFAMTYTTPPPPPKPAPPQVVPTPYIKTLTTPDHIDIATTASNCDGYNLIVNIDGGDTPQLSNSQGQFSIPSTPGRRYAFRAEQHNKGSDVIPPSWSLFSTPVVLVAPPRTRSIRAFLNISGILQQGTGIRQYTIPTQGSTRTMMGL
jgi:hypothetical protein